MWWKIIKRDEEEIRIDAIRLLDSGIFSSGEVIHWKHQFDKDTPEEVIKQIVERLEGSQGYQQQLIPHLKAVEQYRALLFELRPTEQPTTSPEQPKPPDFKHWNGFSEEHT